MSLPRFVVEVVPEPTSIWTVHISHDSWNDTRLVKVTKIDGDRPVPVGDPDWLGPLLRRIADRAPMPDDVKEYGHWLFRWLLADVWPTIRELPAVRQARGLELALKWPVDCPLHQLVWEAMHDGTTALAGDRDLLVAITRIVPTRVEPRDTITWSPKVLFAVSQSIADDSIRPGAMFMGLLRAFDAAGMCVSRAVQSASAELLAAACEEFRPDLVHVVAHGDIVDGNGVIQLARNGSDDGICDADRLFAALTAGGRPLAVVLSACRSGGGAEVALADIGPLAVELVAKGIPIVSAMAGEVSEQACRLYTRRLAMAVQDGNPIVEAAARGRRAALYDSPKPTEQLDWAMPSLFLAESVEPAFSPVDPTLARRLVAIADRMDLRRPQVFIGHDAIMNLVGDLFTDRSERRLGLIAAVRDGSIAGLGGTRLLREMGFRLLRDGHVPLFVGPYHEGSGPGDLRAALVALYNRITDFATVLKLSITRLGIVGDPALTPERLAALDQFDNITTAIEALEEFGAAKGAIRTRVARHLLVADLAAFQEVVRDAGPPFGDHTRLVVLADEVHTWGDPTAFLDLISSSGLGEPDLPVPVVLTASYCEGGGRAVKTFADRASGVPGYAFPDLAPLPLPEASVGFQWVLMHPWPPNCKVYTAAANVSAERVRNFLDFFDGKPNVVGAKWFYRYIDVGRKESVFVADDDEAVWEAYVGRCG